MILFLRIVVVAMKLYFKKLILFCFIWIFLFLIFQVSKEAWVEKKLKTLRFEIVKQPNVNLINTLHLLQKLSPKSPHVWELSAKYCYYRMMKSPKNTERKMWIEKAYFYASRALECNPLDSSNRVFFNKMSKWKIYLSFKI